MWRRCGQTEATARFLCNIQATPPSSHTLSQWVRSSGTVGLQLKRRWNSSPGAVDTEGEMRPGLLLCGLLCAGVHLVLARTFRQRSQTNNGLELTLSKRNVYMPSWYSFVFFDLRYSDCSDVQAVTAESWRFKSRFGLPTSKLGFHLYFYDLLC